VAAAAAADPPSPGWVTTVLPVAAVDAAAMDVDWPAAGLDGGGGGGDSVEVRVVVVGDVGESM
jgi:hypothetical protein